MFPDRKRKPKLDYQKPKIPVTKHKTSQQSQPKIFKPIDLEFKYKKPLIKKCENCGNIVPNFVKKCPFCNNQVIY
jgi:uncharacterized OB-fold protein